MGILVWAQSWVAGAGVTGPAHLTLMSTGMHQEHGRVAYRAGSLGHAREGSVMEVSTPNAQIRFLHDSAASIEAWPTSHYGDGGMIETTLCVSKGIVEALVARTELMTLQAGECVTARDDVTGRVFADVLSFGPKSTTPLPRLHP